VGFRSEGDHWDRPLETGLKSALPLRRWGLNESTVIYETPEYRKPQADEVVEYGGRLWRILNPNLINQEPKDEFTEIHDA
jgi:hypothetical protein